MLATSRVLQQNHLNLWDINFLFAGGVAQIVGSRFFFFGTLARF